MVHDMADDDVGAAERGGGVALGGGGERCNAWTVAPANESTHRRKQKDQADAVRDEPGDGDEKSREKRQGVGTGLAARESARLGCVANHSEGRAAGLPHHGNADRDSGEQGEERPAPADDRCDPDNREHLEKRVPEDQESPSERHGQVALAAARRRLDLRRTRDTLSSNPHTVTRQSASSTMRWLILLVPAVRSTNQIGTSVTRRPR